MLDFASFETGHEDLAGNVLVSEAELHGTPGVDDDGSGRADDVYGWDFETGAPVEEFPLDPVQTDTPLAHGTCAAGLIGAGRNQLGVVGLAPRCKLLNVRVRDTAEKLAKAFHYARRRGARVIVLGFGTGDPVNAPPIDALVVTAMTDVSVPAPSHPHGCVIVAPLSNGSVDNFPHSAPPYAWNPRLRALIERWLADPRLRRQLRIDTRRRPPSIRSLAQHPLAIAVGRSTNRDHWGVCGYGYGTSLLAPSNGARGVCESEDPLGTLDIVTTDTTAGGFSTGATNPCDCGFLADEIGEQNYTGCFGGTSSAAPLVAAAAALVLSADPTLGPADVRSILEETAQRIDPEADTAALTPPPGHFSAPGVRYSSFRGYGRLNAGAAVELTIARAASSTGQRRPANPAERPAGLARLR